MKFFRASGLAAVLVLGGAFLGGCGGGFSTVPGSGNPITLDARLSSSDFYDSTTDRFYDIFVTDALTTDSARVAMRSPDFDTQFYVYVKESDGSYTEIDSNDDADANTSDSDDSFDVTQGRTYRIIATSATPRGSGDYQIRFSGELSTPAQVATSALSTQGKDRVVLPARGKK